MDASFAILRSLQGPANLATFVACLVLGVGMMDDYRRHGSRMRIAAGDGTLRLYIWYGAFLSCLSIPFLVGAVTSRPVSSAVGGAISILTAALGWITIVQSLREKRAGGVTWKLPEHPSVDAAFDTFGKAIAASQAATRQLQKEVRRRERRAGGGDGGG